MSIINEALAPCTKCGQQHKVTVYRSINISENPELKAKVADGSLFLWECPHCGQVNLARYETLYHDPSGKLMVWLIPEGEISETQMQAITMHTKAMGGYTLRRVNDMGSLMETFIGKATSSGDHEKDAVYQKGMIYNLVNAMNNMEANENDLKKFKEHIESKIAESDEDGFKGSVNGIQYTYNMDMLVYTKSTDGSIIRSDTEELGRRYHPVRLSAAAGRPAAGILRNGYVAYDRYAGQYVRRNFHEPSGSVMAGNAFRKKW